jgi:ABC-type phosphate transport system substrate-binding protein
MPPASISFSKERDMKTRMKAVMAAAALSALAALQPTAALADDIVVIVNPQNPATKMLTEQAAQFFLGKSQMFTPVDLPENSPIRAEFYKKVTDKDASQVKAIWSKLVFTGKATMPKEYRNAAEVKKAVAADVNAIGYIEKSALDSSVKAILNVQ